MSSKPRSEEAIRFGIAEWYGYSFTELQPARLREFAAIQSQPKAERATQVCPFLSTPNQPEPCRKEGGVCSLRAYAIAGDKPGKTRVVPADDYIRTTCPYRFEETREVYRWIGETILGTASVVPAGQVPFLKPVPTMGSIRGAPVHDREVGRIDNVLVVPRSEPLRWCAVEVQAVYFSGDSMRRDFDAIKRSPGGSLSYFPAGRRRPDYRSSGPKRLLPQLQVKVPYLSTWGKKMAVVVDEAFFAALGQMKPAGDLSTAEVVWFVVRYEKSEKAHKLSRGRVFMTRLDEARDGLVAAKPLSLAQFEKSILTRLAKVTGDPSQILAD